jgi:hypothetical protein
MSSGGGTLPYENFHANREEKRSRKAEHEDAEQEQNFLQHPLYQLPTISTITGFIFLGLAGGRTVLGSVSCSGKSHL